MSERLSAGEEAELRALVTLAGEDATVGVDRLARLLATLDAARSGPASGGGLDVRRVKQAVVNVAARHGAKSNQPMTVEQMAVGKMFGYSAATPDMDAEIAIEYDRLAATEPTDE
jgi:hypothetical protein